MNLFTGEQTTKISQAATANQQAVNAVVNIDLLG